MLYDLVQLYEILRVVKKKKLSKKHLLNVLEVEVLTFFC